MIISCRFFFLVICHWTGKYLWSFAYFVRFLFPPLPGTPLKNNPNFVEKIGVVFVVGPLPLVWTKLGWVSRGFFFLLVLHLETTQERFLGSTWLLGIVSPEMHASPQTTARMAPTSRVARQRYFKIRVVFRGESSSSRFFNWKPPKNVSCNQLDCRDLLLLVARRCMPAHKARPWWHQHHVLHGS